MPLDPPVINAAFSAKLDLLDRLGTESYRKGEPAEGASRFATLREVAWSGPGHSCTLALTVAVAIALVLGGCGDDGGDGSAATYGGAPPRAAETAGFPSPSSRSLRELIRNMPSGPELAPSVSLLRTGRNRFAFGLFDRGNKQIADLKVALYASRGLDEPARGPYVARFEPITLRGRFVSRQTVDDPDAARSVYVAELPLSRSGGYTVVAVAEFDNRFVVTSPMQVMVNDRSKVPAPGDRAIRVHTPTRSSVGGNIEEIDTRIPPDSMHEVDLAEALVRHRPVLLLFSTPALCQSRVCGPVTDVAEEVKSEYGEQMDFIHMEIYVDNEVEKGPRPQFRAWHLDTEPFAFAIDRRGIVAERLEGAFSVRELRAAVRKALR
jgi:hypothetical protein